MPLAGLYFGRRRRWKAWQRSDQLCCAGRRGGSSAFICRSYPNATVVAAVLWNSDQTRCPSSFRPWSQCL